MTRRPSKLSLVQFCTYKSTIVVLSPPKSSLNTSLFVEFSSFELGVVALMALVCNFLMLIVKLTTLESRAESPKTLATISIHVSNLGDGFALLRRLG